MNCETPVKTVMPPAGSAPALCPVRPRALIADDQSDVLEALRLLLKHDGYEVEVANSPATVLETVRRREFDLLLMDLNYARDTASGREGIPLVRELRSLGATLPILAMTAWAALNWPLKPCRGALTISSSPAAMRWRRCRKPIG